MILPNRRNSLEEKKTKKKMKLNRGTTTEIEGRERGSREVFLLIRVQGLQENTTQAKKSWQNKNFSCNQCGSWDCSLVCDI